MTQKPNIVFMIGCARSGTTSLCKILDTSTNAVFLSEPNPNLNVESRDHLDGKPTNIVEILDPRITKGLKDNQIYGEKNVTLTAFIPELYELYNCKFIYVTRDGRECVNSMYHWHKEMFGNFYRECEEEIKLSPKAQAVIDNLPIEIDTTNYSRPRPEFKSWSKWSLHRMLCWYWNYINDYAMNKLQSIPQDNWVVVDYSSPDLSKQVQNAVEFAGLTGITQEKIDEMLDSRINSLTSRAENPDLITDWRDWSDKELKQFFTICDNTMSRLGYHVINPRHTSDYGEWWKGQEVNQEFFECIYKDRIPQHDAFKFWADEIEQPISVCEIGCGPTNHYSDFWADDKYVGIDLSENLIKRNNNPKHEWWCRDILLNPLYATFYLVFCQGTIENVYDMDLLIKRMVAMSTKYIYITAFKGYFPDLEEHEYKWNDRYKSYDNKLSPIRTRKVLEELKMKNIQIFPQKTNKKDIPHEMVIIAEKAH